LSLISLTFSPWTIRTKKYIQQEKRLVQIGANTSPGADKNPPLPLAIKYKGKGEDGFFVLQKKFAE
jgi:hypothetical protein